uniref:LIM zinc-binding domain-containing protein n=1 Tax=Romanomermis culicivorax TaxID=13658 RepID=A0A915IF00_ROMCU
MDVKIDIRRNCPAIRTFNGRRRTDYVTVFQYFFHPTCLRCRLCKKALTPPTTDLFCAQTFCLGHRGKDISPTTACFKCKKRLPNVFGPDVIVGFGNGYHKACMACVDCQKGPP